MLKINLVLPALTGAIALASCIATADTFTEDFATDPFERGWRLHGDANLFIWNPTDQNLDVTWDSSRPNSYFYRTLDTILTLADEFEFEFDLQLQEVQVGGWGFQIALGFVNLEDATNANFLRGTGMHSPNVFEFNYFPDVGFGPSVAATMTDSSSRFAFWYASAPLESAVRYRIRLFHPAGATNIVAVVLTNGTLYTSLPEFYLQQGFSDFRLNTFSINSYSELGSGGSILARGTVDNVVIRTPPPPVRGLVCALVEGSWQVQFQSQTNWTYTLERTQDFMTWVDASPPVPGTGLLLTLQDTNPPADRAFYRVRAHRP